MRNSFGFGVPNSLNDKIWRKTFSVFSSVPRPHRRSMLSAPECSEWMAGHSSFTYRLNTNYTVTTSPCTKIAPKLLIPSPPKNFPAFCRLFREFLQNRTMRKSSAGSADSDPRGRRFFPLSAYGSRFWPQAPQNTKLMPDCIS